MSKKIKENLDELETETEERSGGKKNLIFLIVGVAVLVGVIIWFSWYSVSSKYFKTENAKVYGGIYQLIPAMPGKLVKLTVDVGDNVYANEIIGRVEGGTYIKSPVDGQIIQCNSKINEMVGQTTVVAVVADTSDLYIKANIEETDITNIKENQEVIVNMDAYPGKKIKAHVKSVDNLTQTALSGNATSFSTSGTYTKTTQLIPIKIQIDDESIKLNNIIGTNATVKIKIK